MVSPPDKRGATIYPLTETGVLKAAEDGRPTTYMTNAPTEPEPKGAYSLPAAGALAARRGRLEHRDIATPHDAGHHLYSRDWVRV